MSIWNACPTLHRNTPISDSPSIIKLSVAPPRGCQRPSRAARAGLLPSMRLRTPLASNLCTPLGTGLPPTFCVRQNHRSGSCRPFGRARKDVCGAPVALVWQHKGPFWTSMLCKKRPFQGRGFNRDSHPPPTERRIKRELRKREPCAGSGIGTIAKCWGAVHGLHSTQSLLPHYLPHHTSASRLQAGPEALFGSHYSPKHRGSGNWIGYPRNMGFWQRMGVSMAPFRLACHGSRCKSIRDGTLETQEASGASHSRPESSLKPLGCL